MTQPVSQGGIGFDAVWYMDFYHNLIGDGDYSGYADLLRIAGYGAAGPLHMDYFAGALWATQFNKMPFTGERILLPPRLRDYREAVI